MKRQRHLPHLRAALETLESRCLLSMAPAMLSHLSDSHESVPAVQSPAANAALLDQLAGASSVTVSTVPSNGDVNPYGLAFVPHGFRHGGPLHAGDLLVSNFNASSNLQGTGTTIVRVTPDGQTAVFFQGPTGLGLTTALAVLRSGFVVVGTLPTTDGTSATLGQGSLIILDRFGHMVTTLTDAKFLDGPWDMTVNDNGNRPQLFVSDVLSGTVTRIDLSVTHHGSIAVKDMVQIGSGYAHTTDPSALVLGPTGLVYDRRTGNLYVASTDDNAVFAIANAAHTQSDGGMGTLIYSDNTHLHGPLGMVMAPNGDLIVANGDAINVDTNQPSELVEFTPSGQFVTQFSLNSDVADGFGLAITGDDGQIRFASVHDDSNTVTIWTVGAQQDQD